MPDSTSQKDIILRHLREIGPITPMEALRLYGCFRLGARIWELKHEGHPIEPKLIDIEGKNVAQYHLVKSDPNGQLCLTLEGAHG